MLSFIAAIEILAFLCYSTQVHSDTRNFLKEYNFKNQHQKLVIGKNHIGETGLLYALCTTDLYGHTTDCSVEFEKDPFDGTDRVKTCDVSFSSEFEYGKIKLLGVDLWGEEKAILTWRDQVEDNSQHAQVTIQVLRIQDCEPTKKKFKVDNDRNGKSRIFIIPVQNSYAVFFEDKVACENNFCKMIVYEDGSTSEKVGCFSNAVLIHGLEPYDGHSKLLLIVSHEKADRPDKVNFYFVDGTESRKLGKVEHIDNLGWSASNGLISFCGEYYCARVSTEGKTEGDTPMEHVNIHNYAAVYNLPNWGYLAVVCRKDEHPSYYLISVRIDGLMQDIFEIRGLRCTYNSKYMTIKFLNKSNGEYCVSIFSSLHSYEGWYLFRKICLSL